jgi:hypothetical protein
MPYLTPGSRDRLLRAWLRLVLTLALLVVVAAGDGVATASANAAIPRPDLAGQQYRLATSDPRVYLVDPEGYLRHIPDPVTSRNLFHVNQLVQVNPNLFSIALGSALTPGSILVKGDAGAAICVLSSTNASSQVVRRCVSSPGIMTKYGFNWSAVRTVPQFVFDALPVGAPWAN